MRVVLEKRNRLEKEAYRAEGALKGLLRRYSEQ